MNDDLRDELIRVKARESRYKKESEARIARLEEELEKYRQIAQAAAIEDEDGAKTWSLAQKLEEYEALRWEFLEILQIDRRLRETLDLGNLQKQLFESLKNMTPMWASVFGLDGAFVQDLQKASERNTFQEKQLEQIASAIEELEKTQKAAERDIYRILPYIAHACREARRKTRAVAAGIEAIQNLGSLDTLLGSSYDEALDKLARLGDDLHTLLDK